MAKNKNESPFKKNVNINNRKASHEYFFVEKFVAGVMLKGTEIKSIRMQKVSLQDAFCLFVGEELIIRAMHIAEYKNGTIHNHEEKADRKLLLKKKELRKLSKGIEDKGMAIVPTRLFINERGFAKIEIALAKGKKLYDKRDSLKEKDLKREMDRSKY